MAAIAYEIARLAAEREHDRSGAARYLQQARILNRAGADPALDERIDQLGRYLAREVSDFTLLADPYRGTPIESLPFAQANSARRTTLKPMSAMRRASIGQRSRGQCSG